MLPFAGYNYLFYDMKDTEHETLRNDVGVLMFRTWEFLLSGPNALALIQK
jgi:hypothetical protein